MKLTHALGATVIVAAVAYAQIYTPDALQSYSIKTQPDQHGQYTVRSNPAAHDFHAGTDIPSRPDSLLEKRWPIIAEYVINAPIVVYYWDGSFRSSNGARWGTPKRWAYYRGAPEVWNPLTGRMEVPGLPGSPPPAAPPTGKQGVHMDATQGQWMVDDLKRSFTTTQIQDMLDASPYDEPDTGAPEAGAGEQ